jgi:hypothetical protein
MKHSSSTPAQPSWPPTHRCENCGWWGSHWLIRLLRLVGQMGQCTHPQVNDRTWRSYVCWRHTAGAHEDLKPSLETLKRGPFPVVEQKLRERRNGK